MNIFFPRFRNYIHHHQLIQEGDRIILGFSGGKDSVTLLILLQELQKELDFQLIAAYFNHQLRRDACQEQTWVENFCNHRQVELVTGGKNILHFKTHHKLNLEHAASLSRYRFFQEVSSRYTNAKVATAHTRSDLSETFLIKLFRGSGLQGLSTIYHRKENTIIRPLLLFHQDEILAFLDRNQIPFYTDTSNETDIFLRNRIRHHVIPEIQKIEPEIHDRIYKTVAIIQDEYAYFSGLAIDILSRHLNLDRVLPARILANHHPAVQRHIIREYLRLLKGNLLNIDFEHIEALRKQHNLVDGLAVPGVELTFHKGFIFPRSFSMPGYSYSLAAPGTWEIKELRALLSIEKTDQAQKPTNNNYIILPAQHITFPLTLRSAQKDDKYARMNSRIKQRVYEMIRSSGIPAELRNLCPVLVNGGETQEIIWVKGSPLAEGFKIKDLTQTQDRQEFLKVSFIPGK